MKNANIKELGVVKCNSICHPELDSGSRRLLNKERLRIKYSMTGNGFTLIELLVVVLIIGILAAVAVPQYQKAVEKARMTEAIMAVEKIAQAQDLYYMANNKYTRDINDLDFGYDGLADHNYAGIPSKKTQYFIFAPSNFNGGQVYKAVVQRIPAMQTYYLAIHLSGARECWVNSSRPDYEKKLCEAWQNGQN